jgi:hypothetical protein
MVEWKTENSNGNSLPSGIYIYRIDATSSYWQNIQSGEKDSINEVKHFLITAIFQSRRLTTGFVYFVMSSTLLRCKAKNG